MDHTATGAALDKGLNHLWSLNKSGQWKGFPTLAGESATWVTGFVLAHISNLSSDKQLVGKTEKFLAAARHSSGGWSYGSLVPCDADSTAWCLLALQENNLLSPAQLEESRAFLWSHFSGNGISTFKEDTGIRDYIKADASQSIDGWTAAHADVSAAAVLADPENEKTPAILSWLLNQQNGAGFINSYWWRGPHYATTILLRALYKCKYRMPDEAANMLLRGLLREQLEDGGYGLGSSMVSDPFTTALALESFTHLAYTGNHSNMDRCGKALLALQEKNGGWAGDFTMRIPAPGVVDPSHDILWKKTGGGGNTFIEDKQGLFATAMSCYALERWQQAQGSSEGEWPVFNPETVSPATGESEIKITVL